MPLKARGAVRVRFWGTRGSIAAPGPSTIRFGGNTSCVELVTASGRRLILDCGTGARILANSITKQTQAGFSASILLGHTHWDHIQGFPFFTPAFDPDARLNIYGPAGCGRSLRDVLAGQMAFTYFPVELGQMGAQLAYHELSEGVQTIEGARVVAQYLHHPAVTLGFRIEVDGVAVVYLCDHEPFSDSMWRPGAEPGHFDSILHEGDRRHARFMLDADLIIHDAQYTPLEYRNKKSWGHSTYEYVVELAGAAGAHRVALTHHDPDHDDDIVGRIEADAREQAKRRGFPLEVFSAWEGCEVELQPRTSMQSFSMENARTAPLQPRSICIMVVDDDAAARKLARKALQPDRYRIVEASSGEEALRLMQEIRPDLLVLDMAMPALDGQGVLSAIRSEPRTAHLPVLLLTGMSDEDSIRAGFEAGATDYLTKPFKMPQLASRVRALLVRAATC